MYHVTPVANIESVVRDGIRLTQTDQYSDRPALYLYLAIPKKRHLPTHLQNKELGVFDVEIPEGHTVERSLLGKGSSVVIISRVYGEIPPSNVWYLGLLSDINMQGWRSGD